MQKCGDFQEPHVCMKSLPTQGRLWYRWRFLVRRSLRWIQIYALIYMSMWRHTLWHIWISRITSGCVWKHPRKNIHRWAKYQYYQRFFVHPSGLLRLSYAVIDPQSWKCNLSKRVEKSRWDAVSETLGAPASDHPQALSENADCNWQKQKRTNCRSEFAPVVMKCSDFWGKSHEFPEFPGSLCSTLLWSICLSIITDGVEIPKPPACRSPR